MASIAQRLAQRIQSLRFADLPSEVISVAKLRLLDFVAVTLPAWDLEEPARIAAMYACSHGGAGQSTILNTGALVPSPMAAFANGVAAHCLELDDDHNTMVGHPGAPTIPAVLAACERENASGKDLLLGIVVAYEVAVRTAQAVPAGTLHERGFHPTGTNGAFGATAGAAKVLGLTADQISNALGICGSQSSGLIQGTDEGVWTKRFNAGWAAHNGVTAATLAKLGLTGPSEVFEGRHGWYRAYTGNVETVDYERILTDWGHRFEICSTSWKPYACNRYSHGPIDCALAIRELLKGRVRADDVESVDVFTFQEALPFTAEPYEFKVSPRNSVDAQFSTYFAVAVALITGRALIEEFSLPMIEDREVLSLAAKVTVSADMSLQLLYPELYPARLIVTMRDGSVFKHEVRTPKGDPELPLTPDEVDVRFSSLAGRVLDPERLDRVRQLIDNAESLQRVGDLASLLVR